LASIDIVGEEFSAPVNAMRPAPEPTSKALTINEVIGSACNKIGGEYFIKATQEPLQLTNYIS